MRDQHFQAGGAAESRFPPMISAAIIAPDRVQRLHDEIARPNASVLLLGSQGSGRLRLAQDVAQMFATQVEHPWRVVELPPPARAGYVSVFSIAFPEVDLGDDDPEVRAARIDEALQQLGSVAGDEPLLIVAPNIDFALPIDIATLMLLQRLPYVRLIATASRMTGPLNRWTAGTNLVRLPVPPLTVEETDRMLAQLLAVPHIVPSTLRRWHAVSRGNAYLLSMLAIEAEYQGRIHYSRDGAWVNENTQAPLRGLGESIAGVCDPDEWALLEQISLLEPLSETVLLRRMPAAPLKALIEYGFVASSSHHQAGNAIEIAHPMLADSIRAMILPQRRYEVFDETLDILEQEYGKYDLLQSPMRMLRLVMLALAVEREAPIAWLWSAFQSTKYSGELMLKMRIAQEVMACSQSTAEQRIECAFVVISVARLAGDLEAYASAVRIAEASLAGSGDTSALSLTVATHVGTELALWHHMHDAEPNQAFEVLAEVADRSRQGGGEGAKYVRGMRALMLACTGRLREAFAATEPSDGVLGADTDGAGALGSTIRALILTQRGESAAAVEEVTAIRVLHGVGLTSHTELTQLVSFAWVLALVANSDIELAHEDLADMEERALRSGEFLVLLGGCAAVIALEEGRWNVALGEAERLIDGINERDVYGVLPVVYAMRAFAAAALGDHTLAERSIILAEKPSNGLGRAVEGISRILLLRARQWVRDPLVAVRASQAAEWAREQQLPDTELQALHVAVCERRTATSEELERAGLLAEVVGTAKGDAMLAHMRCFAQNDHEPVRVDAAEERRLASLGVHLPPPPTSELTAREREIMMLASLGYSNRFIADRLYIALRTVETHLARVFQKLGVTSRDELGAWASRERWRRDS
ncbi:hypothetical protein ICL81_03470 [Leucobacter sp. cx-328]|uniref:LuxR C-terminal-related transcriptional regulator n=1 Tax=unclassified Leucobacter TaxID=2621730 RepID=UPI00165EBB7C|nr:MULTISPECIES: LuxR C-terminal-related transcriptional regulator [unclassified Leucobacter]MBC9943587.1 hypothetical protein [Leucobacter sp. cx-328]